MQGCRSWMHSSAWDKHPIRCFRGCQLGLAAQVDMAAVGSQKITNTCAVTLSKFWRKCREGECVGEGIKIRPLDLQGRSDHRHVRWSFSTEHLMSEQHITQLAPPQLLTACSLRIPIYLIPLAWAATAISVMGTPTIPKMYSTFWKEGVTKIN